MKKTSNSSIFNFSSERKKILIFTLIFFIFSLSFFLRFYRIRDYIIFLGDQGRDVWVVKKMLIDGKFTLLGPVASVGGFYLGPLYYYLIVPFLLLSNFDPIGPAFLPAILGGTTSIVLYFWLKKTSLSLAIISAFFYAISPVLVKYNRFSWNPNVIPFFTLIFYIFLEKYFEKKRNIYLIITGIFLGFLFQLHYLTFVFLPVVALMVLSDKKNIFKKIFCIFVGIIIGWFPFIIYEIRHKMQNFYGIWKFLVESRGGNVGFDAKIYFLSLLSNFSSIIHYLFHLPNILNIFLSFFTICALIFFIFQKKKETMNRLSIFFLLSIIILSFYRGRMGEHYYNFLYIFSIIIVSNIISFLLRKKTFLAIGSLAIISYFSFLSLPFWQEPNRQLDQTIEISKYILKKYVGSSSFNFALVTSGNSDNAYRYFFDLWGKAPLEIQNEQIDPKRKTVTDKLIVLCEPFSPCDDPRGASLWEIAAFGRAEIVRQEKIKVFTIYELKHYNPNIQNKSKI